MYLPAPPFFFSSRSCFLSPVTSNPSFIFQPPIEAHSSSNQYSAMRIFNEADNKDVYVWTTMISRLSIPGLCKEALELFENMKNLEIDPQKLFARPGQLQEAQKFVKFTSIKPDYVMFRTLIWVCRVHGDTERLEHLIEQFQDSCSYCGAYVLLVITIGVSCVMGTYESGLKIERLVFKR
ncbi:hypothetical protein Lser_V15G32677 [Lactuca serriola]